MHATFQQRQGDKKTCLEDWSTGLERVPWSTSLCWVIDMVVALQLHEAVQSASIHGIVVQYLWPRPSYEVASIDSF